MLVKFIVCVVAGLGAGIGTALYNSQDGNLITKAKAYAAAGCEARMSGVNRPAMSCANKGNVGIAASMPIVVQARELGLGDEGSGLGTAMGGYGELGPEGGLIRVYGEVVAFTIGDRLSADTYDVHFEKAYGELQGAYAMINREFARWVRARHPEIRYLNREDDMGVEGLRKAKQSYYPDLMVEKHTAVMK